MRGERGPSGSYSEPWQGRLPADLACSGCRQANFRDSAAGNSGL